MIAGTARCDRVKEEGYQRCACGWSLTARNAGESRRKWHAHIRLVRASLRIGAAA